MDESGSERDLDQRAIDSARVVGATAAGVPVVGIGASAGGLAAFEAFFSAMPTGAESGMAFVLIQHLASDHESMFSDLIKRYTRMQVREVEDGMRIEPNSAYIIPPNRNLSLLNGALELSAPTSARGRRLPIDFFFRSLARAQRDRAVCIVLSGTGTDGTLGARAIKGEGGIVIAQTPESTEYDGMARSVIATGLVDHVLHPGEMPAQLMAYADALSGAGSRPSVPPNLQVQGELEKIVSVLYAHTGHDFSQYKHNTIRRRVERRMAVQQIDQVNRYRRYLEETPGEAEALLSDLLIGVTNFFRDPTAFEALEREVIPRLLANRSSESAIRVWVPGCSTGEEAYSIAILLREQAKVGCKLQVFATDIDPKAIEVARAGVYPASIARDISAERLARHFSRPDEGHYCVRKGIRDLVIFCEQDVTQDPPFSKLDLISCRNLMIYMGVELQQRLIPLFHYALNPGGALFLGTSETVGEFVDLFSTFSATDRQTKLYQRKHDAYAVASPSVGRAPALTNAEDDPPSSRSPDEINELPISELTEHGVSESNSVAALLDETDEGPGAEDARIRVLTRALRTREECFYATREEMQTSNEEFRASIEELQSTNEQLQSTNEKLETSKEQIQSMNDQLATVNAALQSKVADLARFTDDMNRVLGATGIGTIVVDRKICVRRFTAAATQFINLVQADIGRPLRQVVSNLVGYDRLVADVQAVLDSTAPGKIEVQTRASARYLLQIRPYRTSGNVIEGAVITFTEVKLVKDAPLLESALVEPDSLASRERGITN